jgi:hypothetical protein
LKINEFFGIYNKSFIYLFFSNQEFIRFLFTVLFGIKKKKKSFSFKMKSLIDFEFVVFV